MKLIKIINARTAIESLVDTSDEMGANISYWMVKFIMKTQGDFEFYRKELQKLVKKHGSANDDGDMLVPTENMEAFNKELDALANTEAEDPEIRFKLSELAQNLKIPMKTMASLIDFIDGEN